MPLVLKCECVRKVNVSNVDFKLHRSNIFEDNDKEFQISLKKCFL